MDKRVVWIGAGIGSTVGGFVPYLWHDTSILSPWGIICGAIGGVLGIVAIYKLYN